MINSGFKLPFKIDRGKLYNLLLSENYDCFFDPGKHAAVNVKHVHPDKTIIQNVNNTVDFDVSPISQLRDLWTPIKLINQGVVINTNGVTMSFQMNGGTLWGNGINWVNDEKNPDSIAIAGQIPVTFQYRTQTGTQSAFTNRTTIDPNNYDIGGVATPISGTKYTNQRVYLYPTQVVRVQYGQQFYTTLAKAVTGILAEAFIEYVNNRDNGILIGIYLLKLVQLT
jgi:hypothetical protein